jgi:hypothetical protein
MVLRVMKTTLEIPDQLFREMKAAAALRGMKLKDFVTDAISEQLARTKRADVAWSKQRLPPPPKVAKAELKRIHQFIERESELFALWRRDGRAIRSWP